MSKTVLLDVDGVLGSFVDLYLDAFYEITGELITADKFTNWYCEDCPFFGETADKMGLLPSELSALMHRETSRPGRCYNLKPYEEAQNAVERIRVAGARIYAVTSPWDSPTWCAERTDWLRKYFRIQRGEVIFTSAKHLVRGDIFVDDKASNVSSWLKTNQSGKGFVFKAPYNPDGVGWEPIVKAVAA